ncbi:hypothetical protein BGX38DRAFT_1280923 [Terfezia claveryi]|nr:hypothetical protein BGX38DRAFT_1280923 [Terfezia claveryi]
MNNPTTLKSLLAQYSLRENPSGVPLADGRVVTLSGPPLGRVIDGSLHNNALFLERHNLRLPPYAKFAVLPQAKSHLDFAIFQVSPERHGGNWVSLSGVAIDGPVTAVGDFDQATLSQKSGELPPKLTGKPMVSDRDLAWGEETSEIMILASGARVGEHFADLGDSGSMVFRSNADDGYEALGMVVAKNISVFPAWVAATPYWVLIEDAGNFLGEELYLGESGDGGDCDIGEGDGPENQSTR